jgi:hypothetical protein
MVKGSNALKAARVESHFSSERGRLACERHEGNGRREAKRLLGRGKL